MVYYLGIDVGTSGTKALIMDAGGRVLATATGSHTVSAPRPSWSEQNPHQWWSATVNAVRAAVAAAKIDGSQIAGIGLSGQMHGLVCLDDSGKALRPAIIWNDQRTAEQAEQIERTAGGKAALVGLVGNVAMTSFTLTKLMWVRRNEPRIYKRIRHILLPKDYIRLRMTGEYAGDVSDMSGTLMLDQRRRDWSKKILKLFAIDQNILPPVYESHEISGEVTRLASLRLGIPAGVPVVAGAGDQPAGAVGCGVVKAGLVSAAMGTSGVVLTHSPRYITDPAGGVQTFCSAVAGEYCIFGCILSAGGSVQWLGETLGDSYKSFDRQAARVRAGCDGLFFLPYLTGERTPHADPLARGGWIGITARTTRGQLIRSVMEGATFAMNDALTILRARGVRPRQIRLSGGGARSALWRQMQADIYGSTCVTVRTEEGPAYGAAILAAVGAGKYNSVPQACRTIVKTTQTIKPDPETRRAYARYYRQYRRMYPALKQEFPRMAEL
ncbi:MAG: xylulokinase [Planctomycetota bacterium]|nr:xylulokinase [Planctomycetota bacterium]